MAKLIACLLLLCVFSAQSQPVAKVRTYGGAYNDFGSELIETSEGSYAIIGTTGSYGSGQSNMYLIKLNNELEILWSQVFGGNNLEWGQSLIETEDGFLLLGYTNSFGAGGYDVFLVKCNLDGEFQWQKTYGGPDWDFGHKIIEANNGFYIAGESWSFSNGGTDAYLLHINNSGDVLWSQHFGGSENDWISDLFVGENGVIAVGTNSSVSEKSKFYLLEIEDNYNTSEHLFGDDTLWHEGYAGMYHSNGNYYITGATESGDFSNFGFLRLDTEFTPQPISGNPYGGSGTDAGYDITEVSDDQITMVGESNSFVGSTGAFIFRTTSTGLYLAGPTFGGSFTEIARSTIVNSDGQLMFLGETNSFGMGSFDVYLVQLDNDQVVANYELDELFVMDNLLTSIDEEVPLESATSLYPNPSQGHVYIIGDDLWNRVRVHDMRGRLVHEAAALPGNQEIALHHLRPGMYLVELSNPNQTIRLRLLIQ